MLSRNNYKKVISALGTWCFFLSIMTIIFIGLSPYTGVCAILESITTHPRSSSEYGVGGALKRAVLDNNEDDNDNISKDDFSISVSENKNIDTSNIDTSESDKKDKNPIKSQLKQLKNGKPRRLSVNHSFGNSHTANSEFKASFDKDRAVFEKEVSANSSSVLGSFFQGSLVNTFSNFFKVGSWNTSPSRTPKGLKFDSTFPSTKRSNSDDENSGDSNTSSIEMEKYEAEYLEHQNEILAQEQKDLIKRIEEQKRLIKEKSKMIKKMKKAVDKKRKEKMTENEWREEELDLMPLSSDENRNSAESKEKVSLESLVTASSNSNVSDKKRIDNNINIDSLITKSKSEKLTVLKREDSNDNDLEDAMDLKKEKDNDTNSNTNEVNNIMDSANSSARVTASLSVTKSNDVAFTTESGTATNIKKENNISVNLNVNRITSRSVNYDIISDGNVKNKTTIGVGVIDNNITTVDNDYNTRSMASISNTTKEKVIDNDGNTNSINELVEKSNSKETFDSHSHSDDETKTKSIVVETGNDKIDSSNSNGLSEAGLKKGSYEVRKFDEKPGKHVTASDKKEESKSYRKVLEKSNSPKNNIVIDIASRSRPRSSSILNNNADTYRANRRNVRKITDKNSSSFDRHVKSKYMKSSTNLVAEANSFPLVTQRRTMPILPAKVVSKYFNIHQTISSEKNKKGNSNYDGDNDDGSNSLKTKKSSSNTKKVIRVLRFEDTINFCIALCDRYMGHTGDVCECDDKMNAFTDLNIRVGKASLHYPVIYSKNAVNESSSDSHQNYSMDEDISTSLINRSNSIVQPSPLVPVTKNKKRKSNTLKSDFSQFYTSESLDAHGFNRPYKRDDGEYNGDGKSVSLFSDSSKKKKDTLLLLAANLVNGKEVNISNSEVNKSDKVKPGFLKKGHYDETILEETNLDLGLTFGQMKTMANMIMGRKKREDSESEDNHNSNTSADSRNDKDNNNNNEFQEFDGTYIGNNATGDVDVVTTCPASNRSDSDIVSYPLRISDSSSNSSTGDSSDTASQSGVMCNHRHSRGSNNNISSSESINIGTNNYNINTHHNCHVHDGHISDDHDGYSKEEYSCSSNDDEDSLDNNKGSFNNIKNRKCNRVGAKIVSESKYNNNLNYKQTTTWARNPLVSEVEMKMNENYNSGSVALKAKEHKTNEKAYESSVRIHLSMRKIKEIKNKIENFRKSLKRNKGSINKINKMHTSIDEQEKQLKNEKMNFNIYFLSSSSSEFAICYSEVVSEVSIRKSSRGRKKSNKSKNIDMGDHDDDDELFDDDNESDGMSKVIIYDDKYMIPMPNPFYQLSFLVKKPVKKLKWPTNIHMYQIQGSHRSIRKKKQNKMLSTLFKSNATAMNYLALQGLEDHSSYSGTGSSSSNKSSKLKSRTTRRSSSTRSTTSSSSTSSSSSDEDINNDDKSDDEDDDKDYQRGFKLIVSKHRISDSLISKSSDNDNDDDNDDKSFHLFTDFLKKNSFMFLHWGELFKNNLLSDCVEELLSERFLMEVFGKEINDYENHHKSRMIDGNEYDAIDDPYKHDIEIESSSTVVEKKLPYKIGSDIRDPSQRREKILLIDALFLKHVKNILKLYLFSKF